MPKLSDLKAAATAKLGSVHADVLTYINVLESKASASKLWIGAGAVVGAVIGFLIGHVA